MKRVKQWIAWYPVLYKGKTKDYSTTLVVYIDS